MSNPFDRNPYRIPPPWNPGYALPQNVDDEGLERHAFTTAWAPRGSFDNPKVGTAGYAVPAYVKEEGYGQGAFVTRWAPRGSYAGPRVPHWLDKQSAKIVGATRLPGGAAKLQIQALAGIENAKTGGATPLTSYGLKSAVALVEAVKMMPPAMRTAQLRKALDKIDPTLFARAEALANIEAKAGVPVDVALERGLAVAMARGLATEVVELGKGKKPARKSQLGAVCYGCATLGATPQPGECTADGKMIWDVAGFWRRLKVGEVCGSAGSGVVTTRTGVSTVAVTAPSGEVVGTQAGVAPTPIDQKFLQVGPFMIPIGVARWADSRPLSGERKTFVEENMTATVQAAAAAVLRSRPDVTASQILSGLKSGTYPIVKFDMERSEWGLFYIEQPDGGTVLTFKKYETSGGIFQEIWNVVQKVVAKVIDFAKEAAEFVKDKACDLFTSDYGKVAGAAAGAYVGGPAGAAAGIKGAEMAGRACSPTAAVPIPPPEDSKLLPILLVGGGLAAILLLRKKKAL